MEPLSLIVLSICSCVIVASLIHFSIRNMNLPPGPFPIIGSLMLLLKKGTMEEKFKKLHSIYGPVFTFYNGLKPSIVVLHSAAHEGLVQKGLIFSSRPHVTEGLARLYKNEKAISLSPSGQTWRLLRGNLSSKLLTPMAVKTFSPAREWALQVFLRQLESHSKRGAVPVMKTFEFVMNSLLCYLIFGEKIEDEARMKKIIEVHLRLVLGAFAPEHNLWGGLGKFLVPKQWQIFLNDCKERDDLLLPLLQARRKTLKEKKEDVTFMSYADSLFELQNSGENIELEDTHLTGLCSEMLIGGSHTTTSVSQWIMANLVKYQHIQDKLFNEISKVVDAKQEIITDQDLKKIPYLEAVVLETMRRHPLGYFLMPHATTEETTIQGYSVPKGTTAWFVSHEAGFDPQIWEDPMEFRPERFLPKDGEEIYFDVAGSKEIKMLPFGAGKRICPGFNLGLLHLQFFVANIIWKYKWTSDGKEVDLEPAPLYSRMMVLKNPLRAHISPRIKA